MTQAKERLLTDTYLENDSIILDLQEFDLNNLQFLQDTALGNILEKKSSSSPTQHTSHTDYPSHVSHSSSLW